MTGLVDDHLVGELAVPDHIHQAKQYVLHQWQARGDLEVALALFADGVGRMIGCDDVDAALVDGL